MMKVIMICGYRTSGKDTFYSSISGFNSLKWDIIPGNLFPLNKKYKRIALADMLKNEINYIEDGNKDKKTIIENGELISPRDLCIKRGYLRRKQDPDYWCKLVINDLDKECYNVITDWRYPNEYLFFNRIADVITVRVKRIVEIPPEDVESEHSLDDFVTDFIVYPN
jgi:hypothetical protein